MSARRPEWTEVESNVRIGGEWLATSEQPDNAVMSQFGHSAHVGGHLRVEFSSGHFGDGGSGEGVGLVVFKLHNPDTTRYGGGQPDPFTERECEYLRGLIDRLTPLTTTSDWNGAPYETYSVAVTGVGSGPQQAYRNYSDGCPVHHTVFCGPHSHREEWRDCTWLSGGREALVEPRWVAVDRPGLSASGSTGDDDRNLRAVKEALETIRPLLAEIGYHPDTIVAGRRGDITDDDGALSFEAKSGHGVCLPAEVAVRLTEMALNGPEGVSDER